MIQVVGLGAGGHAKIVVDILRLHGGHEIVALLDPNLDLHGTQVMGVPVLGGDELLPELVGRGVGHAFVGLGSAGDTGPRRRLYELAGREGLAVVDAVHPAATIASSAALGGGATVMAGAVINAEARLGENVVVNTGAVVEHDCIIGDHVHVATGAVLGGGVEVGEDSHVGLGARVNQGVRIGRASIVGSGAVVVEDVEDGVVVVGVPARVSRRRDEG